MYGDVSTVPAGSIKLDDVYIYAMRVEWWNPPPKQTHAKGVLFKENESGGFDEVFNWSRDVRVNNAPILVGDTVYMVYTNLYRNSPVYLSCVDVEEIEDRDSYRYFSGRTENGEPIWSENIEDAIPLEGTDKMRVGEISFVYNPILDVYLIMFDSFSIKNSGFWLYYSKEPFGPYSRVKVGVLKDDSWLQENWSGLYGGYIIPYMFGDDGRDIYFTISIWKPYITVVMKTSFDIEDVNIAPEKPSTPKGVARGKPGVDYSYTVSTVDENLDQIYYMFDWGDGNYSEWLGPYPSGVKVEKSHRWNSKGVYNVKVKAKDIYGLESSWSDPLKVKMPISEEVSYRRVLPKLLWLGGGLSLLILLWFLVKK